MRNLRHRLASATLSAIFVCSSIGMPSAIASPTGGTTTGTHAVSTPVSLNLSSTSATVPASSIVGQTPVRIRVGHTIDSVSSGDLLTPAEWLAVYQVLHGGTQRLVVGTNGAATAGSAILGPQFGQLLTSLTVPKGVSVFDRSSVLNISGNLTDLGRLYASSTSPTMSDLSILASNITVGSNGLLSTIGGGATKLNLSLVASNDISNAGTIFSGGSLNLTAGGSITNALPTGVTGPQPTIHATNDVSLTSGIGQISNDGLVASARGNIDMATVLPSTDLNVNAVGGTFSALQSNINVRDANFSEKSNVTVIGGNFLSNQFNLYSGQGTVDVNVGQVTGVVNVEAGAAHVTAATKNLQLGNIDLSGDPSFYNTTGAVTLSLPLTIQGAGSGADLAVIANTDINVTGTGNIDVSSSSGNGGNILFIAGAQFTSNPPTTGQQNNDFSGSTLSITGASSTGGRIDLTRGTIGNITSSSTVGNAGNITLIAFTGTATPGSGAGKITLSTSTAIDATGAAGFTNGNVTLIAGASGATPVTAISTGPITTFASGGATTGGNITVATATPNLTSTLLLTNNANGSVTGTGSPPISVGTTQANASISTGALQAAQPGGGAGTVSVLAGANAHIAGSVSGSNVNVGSNSATAFTVLSSGSVTNGIVGTINAYSSTGSDGGSITLSNASGDIVLGEGITSAGTNLALVASGNISTTGASAIPINTSSASTNGGNISMVAGAQLVSSINSVQVTGSGAGGNIDLATAPGITSLNSFTSATSANGGNVSLVAFGGAAVGTIAIPSSVTVTSSGSGSGTNGNVTMIAGDTTVADTAIRGGFSVTTSGGTGGNGNILLAAATPNITCTGCASPSSSVTVTNGTTSLATGIFGGGALRSAGITVGNLNTDNSLNQVYSAGTITFAPGSTASGCVGCTLVGGSATSTVNNPAAGITTQTTTNVTVPSALATANVPNLTVQTINNGTVNVANNLSDSTSSTMIADGSGAITTANGITITSGTIALTSKSGDINVSVGGTPSLTTNTAGNATITAAGVLFLNTSNVGSTFSVSAGGNIAMATAGSIITAGTISLASTSGDINVNVGGTPYLTANTPGSATITAAGDILLGASNAGSTFSVSSGGSITTIGTIASGQITFNSASNTNIYSSVTANNGITINATGGMSAATANSTVMTTTVGTDPNGIAVNAAGTLAYVANQLSNSVSVINLGNGTVIGTIPVGVRPWGIALDPSGKFAYVANSTSGTVSVISTATNTVIDTISVGSHPLDLTLNPSGTKVYVCNAADNTVSVIDTSTLAVTATITVGQIPAGVGVNPAGTRAYVANAGSNTVSVIDTATNLVIATVPVGSQPQSMAVNSAGTFVYVANNGGSSVSVIDASTNTLAATLSTASTPYSVAINPAGTLLLVPNEAGTVQAFSTNTNTLVATAQTGTGNLKIAINPTGTIGWITTFDGVSAVAMPGISGLLSSSSTILLTSTSGNMGFSSAPINTNSTNLQFNSHGSAYLNSLSAVVVTGLAGNGINLVSAAAIAIGASGITNSHGSVTITASGDITASVPSALAITSPSISLTATGGNIGGNIGATVPLLVTSGGTSGLTLFAKSTQVSGSGGIINLSDTTNEVVTLANGTQAGSTLTMSSANSFVVAGAVSAQGNITIAASAPAQISSPYPLSFDLSATTPSLTIPSNGPGLIVNSSGTLTSASGSISINGQTQSSSSLGSGSYDLADYSILISGGSGGTLTVTPSTLVTPAEWVAALQVQTLSSQPLTVGANNAASGGSFTIASANIPSIGFNSVTVPASVTANISAPNLFTRALINNGTIQPSGTQTNLTLGNLGGSNQNFEVGGTGSFVTSGGTVTFRTAGGASGILIIDAGTNFSVTGSLTMTAPTIKVGTTGSATAVITTAGSPITIQSVPAGSSSLSFTAGGTAATLTLNGGAVFTNSNFSTNIGANFSLVAGTSISMTDTAGGAIATASGGLIASPIISLVETGGNIGTSASAPLSIASSLSVPGTVSLSVNAKFSAWLTDALPNDAVRFNNGTASSQASAAFSLNTSGNILAINSGNPAVTSPIISLNASGGNIAANAGATTPLSVTSGGITGLNLFVNATKPSGTGGTINVSDTANEPLTLANGTAAAGGLTVSSGRSIVAAGTVSATGNIVITTLAPGQITANFPTDLSLTETTPTLNIPPASSQTLLVNSGAQVSGASISINGQVQASNTLGPGSYGFGPAYSVQIAGGPSGTLTITPSTLVTPAEWVAAVQVQYGGSQTLTVGTNNAASGGSLSITPSDVPSSGFSTIVIPGSPGAVTAFLPTGSIQTNSLINNGTVQVSGTQTNLPITSVGTTSGNLEIGGTGSFVAPSGTVSFQPASGVSNTLTIDGGTNLAVTGSLKLLSQNIVVGSTGAAAATLTTNGNPITIQPTSGTGSLSFTAGGSASSLNLNGGAVTTTSTSGTSIGANFSLSSGTSISMSDTGGSDITTAAGGLIASPIISLLSTGGSSSIGHGNLGTSAVLPLYIASNTSVPGIVKLVAISNRGSVWLQDPLAGDAVQFDNNINSSTSVWESFSLVAAGNIQSDTPSTTAVVSPNISLTAVGGNIGGNATASVPLNLAGVGFNALRVILVSARVGSDGGSVNVTDTQNQALVLANTTGSSGASVSFTLNAAGSILVDANSTAITSPTISLTSTGGSILNGPTTPMLVSSGGTSGLNLFASAPFLVDTYTGGEVNLKDPNSETVTLNNSTNPLYGWESFTLSAAGNIRAATAGSTAVTSQSISLTAIGGNIAADTAGTSPLLISTGNGFQQLYVNATKVSGSGGVVNIASAYPNGVLVLNNASAPLNASVSLTLAANGYIAGLTQGNLAITSPYISLTSTGANISGCCGGNPDIPLLVNSGGTSGLTLLANATQVSGLGGNVNISDTNTEIVTLANGTHADNALTLASGIAFIAAGTVSAGGNISLTASGLSAITSTLPSNLDLSQTNPSLTIPAANSGLIVNSGATVTSTSGTIAINGQSLTSPLGPGSYGSPNYSITITGGPSGSLTITPSTLVTPAEWVAAIQVQASSNQTLTIGANNAASGGNFTITLANIPSGGFSTIVISGSPSAVTANVSDASLSTSVLVNNGIIQPSGTQTSITVTSAGTSSGNLELGGTGTFLAPTGTVSFQTAAGASNALTIDGGTSFAINSNLLIVTPSVVVGSTGAATSTLTVQGSLSQIQPSLSGSGSLTFSPGGSSAILNLNGAPVSTVSDAGVSVGANFTLAAGTSISISDSGFDSVTTGSGGLIASPSITVKASFIGTSATSPLFIASNPLTPGTVSLLAQVVQGDAWFKDSLIGDSVEFNNSASLSSYGGLNTGSTFSLVASGNILASTPGNVAVFAQSISLNAVGGNIGQNAAATSPLLVANGYNFMALLLFANATQIAGNGGVVNLSDSSSQQVTLANTTAPSNASVAFTLATNGFIVAATPANSAITSPRISLTTSSGNISGDGPGTSPLLINSGGTSGLTLFAAATSVNLSDTNSEAITLANGTTPLSGPFGFALSAGGSIIAATAANTAVTGLNISLTATGGNIGGNGASSSPLLINSGGNSALTLFANATQVIGSGGNVNISDTNTEAVILSNGSTPLNAAVALTLAATGNIVATTAGNTAITSPTVELAALGGNIGANATASSPLLLRSGGTSGLSLFANATKVSGSGGTVNISDAASEAVTLSNGASPSNASIAFTLSANSNIVPSTTTNPAVTSPSISLTATGGNIAGNATATSPLLVNSGGPSGLTLYANATQVSANGGNVNISDTAAEVMTLTNGTFATDGLTLTSGSSFVASGTVSAGGNITLTALPATQIINAYPVNLDLSQTVPSLTIPAVSSLDLTIIPGGQLSSTTGTIAINGQTQQTSLGPGSYGATNYAVTISVGSSTLVITPTTLVTPAEWVAAIQVQNTSGQPLAIGANNAASGGSFTIASANLPSGGFTNIVIPNKPAPVTAFVSVPSLQTNTLINNGTIQTSGGQTSLVITSIGTGTGNLTLGGNETFSATGVTINAGTLNMLGTIQAPGANVTINASAGAQLNNITALSIAVQAGGTTSATLGVNNNAALLALNGSISLEELSPTGSINIGKDAYIFASGAANSSVQLSIGSTAATSGTRPPANVRVTKSDGGTVLFGTNGILADAPLNQIYAKGQNATVTFKTGTATKSAITLGGGDQIGATTAQPLSSLDLTQPSVVATIKAEQAAGLLGGKLTFSGSTLTGGTIILTPMDVFATLSSVDIVPHVSVTFKNFDGSHPTIGSAGAVLIGGRVSAPSGVLSIQAGGDVTISAPISARTISLITTTGSNSSVTIDAKVTATNGIAITTDGSGDITTASGTIMSSTKGSISLVADAVTLNGLVKDLAGSVTLDTNALGTASIVVGGNTGTFNVSVTDLLAIQTRTLTIGSTNDAGGLSLVSALNVPSRGPGAYNLTLLNGGSVSANGNSITLGTKQLTINAVGSVSLDGTVTAGSLNLTSSTGDITVSSASTPALTVNTGTGNATVTDARSVKLGTSSVGNTLTLIDTTGSIVLGSTVTALGSASLTTQGTGSISQTSARATPLFSPIITLQTNNGSIGSSSRVPVRVGNPTGNSNPVTLTANVTGTTGNIFLASNGPVSLGTSRSVGTFSVTDSDNLSVTGAISSSSGSISLIEAGTGKTISIDGNVTAAKGNITIQNKDGINGTITVGNGTTPVTIATGNPPGSIGGTVSIFTGLRPSLTNSTPGLTGLAVTSSGTGKVYLGANPTALTFTGSNFANAINRNVILSAGSATGTITLDGQVTITADPPTGAHPVSNPVLINDDLIVDSAEDESESAPLVVSR